ncbi:MAG: cytochrome C peroxidase [Gemmataceae bacterium]|nr:cytochrome C peroxidase [Gemmataceae bacterium]
MFRVLASWRFSLALGFSLVLAYLANAFPADANPDWQIPNPAWLKSHASQKPMVFINRSQHKAEWEKLPSFWNESKETIKSALTGEMQEVAVVKIKLPMGITQNPPIPLENAPTVAKWKLGKKIYFDPILSSDGTVSCSSCHHPAKGFTDQSRFSTGIKGNVGGMNAPTVYNSAFNLSHFWDGRAISLEDQSQGPPQNPLEMFDGKGAPWHKAVERMNARPDYVEEFRAVFGTLPNRDGAAKAMATYERTVVTGNSIHDRAETAMRKRVEEAETGKLEVNNKDYEKVLQEAAAAKDVNALEALKLKNPSQAEIAEAAKGINQGRALFFGKARCNGCHVGDSLTDSQFHNLGVGVKNGELPKDALGRYGAQPTGHKNPEHLGAFKTPPLRQLLHTAPYMHDGSEDTLEKVVEFYDKGGNANPFLDTRMRDFTAEKGNGKVIPLALKLTIEEKASLVIFMRALNGEPADPIVTVLPGRGK